MNLSIEKQNEISKQVTEQFERFKADKGLIKSNGRTINPIELLEKIDIAIQFSQDCKVSIHHSNDEELKLIKKRVEFEVQIVVNDIVDNY